MLAAVKVCNAGKYNAILWKLLNFAFASHNFIFWLYIYGTLNRVKHEEYLAYF